MAGSFADIRLRALLEASSLQDADKSKIHALLIASETGVAFLQEQHGITVLPVFSLDKSRQISMHHWIDIVIQMLPDDVVKQTLVEAFQISIKFNGDRVSNIIPRTIFLHSSIGNAPSDADLQDIHTQLTEVSQELLDVILYLREGNLDNLRSRLEAIRVDPAQPGNTARAAGRSSYIVDAVRGGLCTSTINALRSALSV